MSGYQLPTDGSVIIIDDIIGEALPLIKLLSQKGIASTYYTGRDTDLPKSPTQKIRLAFVDIQLFGPSDAHSYAQNILRILNQIIPDNNGPYILIVWSKTEDINADRLESELTAETYPKRPVTVLRLSKSSFFNLKVDESVRNDLIAEIRDALKIRFDDDDIRAIEDIIAQQLPPDRFLEAKRNALELISKALYEQLIQKDAFRFFTIWESIIKQASGKIVTIFSTLHKPDKFWQDNLKSSIYRMAHAQLGKTVDFVEENELIKNALKTLNHTFLDVVENEISKISNLSGKVKIDRNSISFSKEINNNEFKIKWKAKTGKYQLFVAGQRMPAGNPNETGKIQKLIGWGGNQEINGQINSVINEYLSIKTDINTRLLIDFSAIKSIYPGNVYQVMGIRLKRKKSILGSYFDKDEPILSNDLEVKKIILVELEVSPLCDCTQDKWLKSRRLPGILIPDGFPVQPKTDAEYSYKIPLFKIGSSNYLPVFDFRLLNSTEIIGGVKRLRKPLFKIRNELFADILSRLSSHANRIGITCLE
jgi:hypothetical protein